jgi:hypothetical protein
MNAPQMVLNALAYTPASRFGQLDQHYLHLVLQLMAALDEASPTSWQATNPFAEVARRITLLGDGPAARELVTFLTQKSNSVGR